MVLGKDCKSLLGLVLVDEESRRLRDPPDAAELDDGWNGLDEGDGSPRPIAVNRGSAPTDNGNN
jgi:hypothetical protein